MRLYIDPGTGSMLFTILIGLMSALVFAGRKALMKLRFLAGGGRVKADSEHAGHKDFVIFSDHKRYWNVFEPVCDEFEKRGIELHYMTASPDDPGLQKPYRHVHASFIGEGNAAFARLNLLDAGVVLSTTPGLDVYQWKRSKNVRWYVHILHAANDPSMYRMFGLDYYDAVLLSGDYQVRQIRELEEKRGLSEKELVMCGLTYYDAMRERLEAKLKEERSDGQYKETAQDNSFVRKNGVEEKNRPAMAEEERNSPTILVAPSWGENSLLHRFGSEGKAVGNAHMGSGNKEKVAGNAPEGSAILRALVATGYRIIVRPHPQMLVNEPDFIAALQAHFKDCETLSWNTDNDNFDVLNASDLLISDFSGVIFDFALVFDKPVLYTDTEFDTSALDCWQADEALWTFEALPKIGRKLTADLLKMEEISGEASTERRKEIATGDAESRIDNRNGNKRFESETEKRYTSLKELIDNMIKDSTLQQARDEARKETWCYPGEAAVRCADYMNDARVKKSNPFVLAQKRI